MWGARGLGCYLTGNKEGIFEKMVTLVVTYNPLLLQEFNEPFKHGGQRWNRTGPHSAPTRGFSDRLAYLEESLDPTDIAR